MQTNIMNQISWKAYQARINDTFLILPVGSTEQHAPHLPLGVDAFLAEKIARTLAQKMGAIVAPTINYGYKSLPTSGGGPLFPGTTDLNAATITALIKDIIDEFRTDGWQKILILNGHFENTPHIIEACDLLFRTQPTPFPKVVISDWYDNMSDSLIPTIFDQVEFPGWELEHAAIVETSVMLHFMPELVEMDKVRDEGLDHFPAYHVFPPSKTLIPESGCLHTAKSASAAKGKMIVDDVINNIAVLLENEFDL